MADGVYTALEGVAPMPFVGLTGGEFTMGGEAYDDEKPRHRVSLPAFQIATTPVTIRQWRAVMKSVPEDNGNGDECPVVNVCYERHDVDVGGPDSGDRRVLRGGAFADVPEVVRSAVRDWLWPSVVNGLDGLRVARGARAQRLAR